MSADQVLTERPSATRFEERLLATRWNPRHGRWWWPLLLLCGGGVAMLIAAIVYTVTTGVGVWGNDVPVAWAFGITNFVWWIGLGHAGTFISAILYLCGQRWRTAINRIAETMTLFAVLNAAMFPLLHLGRPWFAYWLVPYPSTTELWPQFRSALPWDVVAITTYGLISLVFWYVGLIPDLATLRDVETSRAKRRVFDLLALGWRGTGRQWSHHQSLYLLLAGLATPLVISVHTIVSLDFAITQLPGFHSAIFPPFFVAGAIFSGFAMVLVLVIPIRRVYRLQGIVTEAHLDRCAKLTLVTGWIVLYTYLLELFLAWWSGEPFERYQQLVMRPLGPAALPWWGTIVANCVAPQLLWWSRVRRSEAALFLVSLAILVGMWLERFVIVVASQQRDFLPSSWGSYLPTPVDGAILAGTCCLFGFLYLLFLRFLPFLPLSELRELRHELATEDRERADAREGGARAVPAR